MELSIKVMVKGVELTALVDSGAQYNFISPETVRNLKLPWKKKADPYELNDVSGTPIEYNNGVIDQEIDHLKVKLEGKNHGINFDVLPI